MRLVFLFLRWVLFASAIGGLHAHEEIARAIGELDAEIAASPKDPALYLRRAGYQEAHGEWAAAEADLLRAAALSPNASTEIALAIARVQLASGQFSAARQQLNSLLALTPGETEALILRARLHARLGEPKAAYADYSQALRTQTASMPDLYLARAALPVAPAAVLAGLDEGLARLGPAAALLDRACDLAVQLGQTDRALRYLDQLAAHLDRREVQLQRRGQILAAAGRTAEARVAYTVALASLNAQPEWLRATPDSRRLAADLSHATSALK